MGLTSLAVLLALLAFGNCREIIPAAASKGASKSLQTSNKSNNNSLLRIPRINGGKVTNNSNIAKKSSKVGPSDEYKKQLWMMQLLMLIYYLNLGVLFPFLPLYYKKLGIDSSIIGFLGSITPTLTFFVAPLWGALADSTQQSRTIMLVTFISGVIARLGLIVNPDFISKSKHLTWLIFVVSVSAILNAPVKPLMDDAVLKILVDKSDYGRNRLYGQLGFGIGSCLVGPLINIDIRWAFYIHALSAIPTIALMMYQPISKNDLDNKRKNTVTTTSKNTKIATKPTPNTPNIFSSMLKAVLNPDTSVFFLIVTLIGVSSGIVENFAYIRIEEVAKGSIGNSLGICRLVSSIAAGPMFYLSGSITKKIGINNVLALSLLSYFLRFINYALIKSPLQAIPAEILRGLTFGTFWSAATYYVYSISPSNLTATMLSLLNCVYAGIGQSLGALVGGLLINKYGIRDTFLKCGIADFIVIVLYKIYIAFAHGKEKAATATTTKKKK